MLLTSCPRLFLLSAALSAATVACSSDDSPSSTGDDNTPNPSGGAASSGGSTGESGGATMTTSSGGDATVASCDGTPAPEGCPQLGDGEWLIQFGTTDYDGSSDVLIDDAGDIYIVGNAAPEFFPGVAVSTYLGFLRKLSGKDGSELWTYSLSDATHATFNSVNFTPDGDLVLTGVANSSDMDGNSLKDALVVVVDTEGVEQWHHIWGTPEDDTASEALMLSNGDVLAAGRTEGDLGGDHVGQGDAFVSRIPAGGGTPTWSTQWGTRLGDGATQLVVSDGGSIYVGGTTTGDLMDPENLPYDLDYFVTELDPSSGAQLWLNQLVSDKSERLIEMALDGTELILMGDTDGELEAGQATALVDPALVRVSSTDGSRLSAEQFGNSQYTHVYAADYAPGFFVAAGNTAGMFGDEEIVGHPDAYALVYNLATQEIDWLRQWGTEERDSITGVKVGTNGEVVVYGTTELSLVPDARLGGTDLFVHRFPAGTVNLTP